MDIKSLNQFYFFLTLFIFCFINIEGLVDIAYRDCARGEIKSLRIEPCAKEPCNFGVGDTVTVIVDFVANHNTSRASLQGLLSTGGIFNYEIEFPGIDTQACGPEPKLKCPLVAGNTYTFAYKGVVPLASRFSIFRTSTWKLVGEKYKTLTCAEIPLQRY